jgi:hypothetical protein
MWWNQAPSGVEGTGNRPKRIKNLDDSKNAPSLGMQDTIHAVSADRQTSNPAIDLAPRLIRGRRRIFGRRRLATTLGPIARGQRRGLGPLKPSHTGYPLSPRPLPTRAIGRTTHQPSFATIARELLSLLRWIRNWFYLVRLVSSL